MKMSMVWLLALVVSIILHVSGPATVSEQPEFVFVPDPRIHRTGNDSRNAIFSAMQRRSE